MEKLEAERIFLTVAGKVIEFYFEPSEQGIVRNILISNIKKVWDPSGFLAKKPKRSDFQIRFFSNPPEILVRGNKYYYLDYKKAFDKKRIDTSYYLSLASLQLLLKDVISYLFEKEGFFLHGSSVIGKDKILRVFLAPSGGGKTTAASLLLSEFKKFSDDSILVVRIGKGWNFFSPPFIEKNHFPKRKRAERAEFYFLKKSGVEKKILLDRQDILLKKIISQIWLRGAISPRMLKLISQFIKEHDFYQLSFGLKSKLEKTIK